MGRASGVIPGPDFLSGKSDEYCELRRTAHDSSKYHKYYAEYGADPIVDVQKIAVQCFRAVIFDGLLQERPARREQVGAAPLPSRRP
jgi:hypothetical protein